MADVRLSISGDIQGHIDALESIHLGGSFPWALLQLQAGQRVRRMGWNGRGMYLVFSPRQLISPARRTPTSNQQHGEGVLEIGARIDIMAADGIVELGWRPTSRDMFAHDWELAD